MAADEMGAERASEGLRHRWRTVSVRLRPWVRRVVHPVAALAILGVAFAVLGALHLAAGRQMEESSRRVASARQALSRPAPQADQLSLVLRGWEVVLIAARSSRVAPLADAELVRRTLELADASGVALIDAGTRPEFVEDIDGRPYRAVPYLVKTRGSLPGTEAFLHAMESSLVDTLEIRGSVVTADRDGYILTLSAVVYSYLPETDLVVDEEGAEQPAPVAVSSTAGGGRR